MSFLRIAVLSVLATLGCHATHADAKLRAQEWMRKHAGQDPDEQGLNELKATNPDAYAIVTALLTKRSLGMLNLKHPSASFNPGADADRQQQGPSSLDVLRASEAQPGSSVDAPVDAVAVSSPVSHHAGSWLNWKPASDEDAVKNVLGAVADLKGGAVGATSDSPVPEETAPPAQEQEQAPAQEQVPARRLGALSFNWGSSRASSAATERAAAPPPAPQNQDPMSSYLSEIGGGSGSQSSSSSSSPAAPAKPEIPQGNALASFSFDDDDKANTGYLQQQGTDQQAASQGADQQPAAKSAVFSGALGKFLR